MDAAKAKAQRLIDENAVMVFSKSYCPYCQNTKRTLDSYGAKYGVYELNVESDGSTIQDALRELTGQRTVPNVFINQKHIGGDSDLQALAKSDLQKLLKESNAI